MTETFRVAIAQAAPVLFDRERSTEKACELIGKAGAEGAALVAFGECWLPGYPIHVGMQIAGGQRGDLNARYIQNAVEVPSDTTARLCEAAAAAGTDVAIGIAELDPNTRGSVYATLLFISSEGEILGRHRKLKPTTFERMSWGDGDGDGLRVYQRPYARISGLNCWEHNMMLPGYTLVAQGTQLHVATWPGGEPDEGRSLSRQTLLSRAFASQGACYVLLTAAVMTPDDAPDDAKDLVMPMNGRSAVIDPFGEIVAGPAEGETILTYVVDLDVVRRAKAFCDIAGHYSRKDILRLQVKRGDDWTDVNTVRP